MIIRYRHTGIVVRNIQKSRRFYCDLLNLKIIQNFIEEGEYFNKLIKDGSKYLPITHPSMTRFWITINQGVNLVAKSFHEMVGGEIFIPIIPSIRIVDLAKAIAPKLPHKIIGIRPGEKIHEIMCSKDDSSYVLKFKNYYVITPNYEFSDNKKRYLSNKSNEIGKSVKVNFE